MFSCRLTLFSLLGAASLFACSSGDDDSDGNQGPCETESIPGCGESCDSGNPCPTGTYCGGDGECTADCTPAGDQCEDSEECDETGQCVPVDDDDNGDNVDDGEDDDGGDEDCPAVEVNLTPLVPDVILLLDQSGSMVDGFPEEKDPRRWDALRAALIGTGDDGLLFDLQSNLNMGATLYTSDDGTTQGGTCPILTSVDLAVNNAQAIADLLEDNEPVEDTPTAESVTAVSTLFPDDDKPHIIVLATDGLPDTCEVPDPETPAGQAASEAAVQAAFDLGVTTFVLAVGPDASNPHFQRLANAGQGEDLATGEVPFFPAQDPAELTAAFEAIIGGIRTCEITVEEAVDLDQAEDGTVVLNGDELVFGTDWDMPDEHTIVLLGSACDTFLTAESVSLSAEFPCGGVGVD